MGLEVVGGGPEWSWPTLGGRQGMPGGVWVVLLGAWRDAQGISV